MTPLLSMMSFIVSFFDLAVSSYLKILNIQTTGKQKPISIHVIIQLCVQSHLIRIARIRAAMPRPILGNTWLEVIGAFIFV